MYAKTNFKERDVILTETPLVCAQFSWNELYKYAACEFCLRSLETAEDMSRRLSDNPAVVLPHPECCEVDSSSHTCCPHCQVCVIRDILYKSYAYRPHTHTHTHTHIHHKTNKKHIRSLHQMAFLQAFKMKGALVFLTLCSTALAMTTTHRPHHHQGTAAAAHHHNALCNAPGFILSNASCSLA